MEEKITLDFDDKNKYHLTFAPPGFWLDFARGYDALPWEEVNESRVSLVAENYSYLLDLLVQARLYYLASKPIDERYK